MSRSSSGLSAQQQRQIQDLVGRERARFDRRERRVYSHDISVLPGVIRRLANSVADGVVRPQTEADLVGLVRYAAAEKIPLVPRGNGTSGYGGAVPARGGLVVDVRDLKGVIECDEHALWVTVGAGTVWKDLEASLAERGLGLRLYPTSAPSSTVGGWLAQGGAGIGSYAYGWFSENVRGARVVIGSGEILDLNGSDIRGVADAEGITGIITRVTLDLQPARRLGVEALTFDTPQSMAVALRMIGERALRIWSIQFVNPTMARLTNRSRQGAVELPVGRWPEVGYTCVLAYDVADRESIDDALREICPTTSAERQPSSVAEAQWSERFRPMRLKRLGPSLVTVEVVVPLANVAAALEELDRRIQAPMAIEGLVVRGNEVVLMALVPHDERTTAYMIGHGFAISALQAAEQCGGRPYSTGRLFGGHARQVLGDERFAELTTWKAKNDPAGILNPGKVLDGAGMLGHLLNGAWKMEPLVRRLANRFGGPTTRTGGHLQHKALLPDVVDHAYACAQCGYCVDVCPQFQDSGWESSSPRGKWHLLKEVREGRDRFDIQLTNIFALCVQCRKCDEVCQLELPIESSWSRVNESLFDGILTRTS
jgi:FAD/FMN-containing dehydrogenase/ferredoxin